MNKLTAASRWIVISGWSLPRLKTLANEQALFVLEGLPQNLPVAVPAWVGSVPAVSFQPGVQVRRQVTVQDLVEPLADAVGLRAVRLGPGMVDIPDGQAVDGLRFGQ